MALVARFTADPTAALEGCESYLVSGPVAHNVVLTVVRRRSVDGLPGRYWWVEHDGAVVGFAMWAPLTFHMAAITPVTAPVAQTLVDVMSETVPDLPGVAGDAAAAASFAGSWAERLRVPATPVEAQRMYRLADLCPPNGVPGRYRRAGAAGPDTP